jgi:hypothetical protein
LPPRAVRPEAHLGEAWQMHVGGGRCHSRAFSCHMAWMVWGFWWVWLDDERGGGGLMLTRSRPSHLPFPSSHTIPWSCSFHHTDTRRMGWADCSLPTRHAFTHSLRSTPTDLTGEAALASTVTAVSRVHAGLRSICTHKLQNHVSVVSHCQIT